MGPQDYLSLSMKLKTDQTDSHIIHQLRDEFVSGDDNAYSKIYKLYANDLYSFGLSLHVKIELIEDAIHDVFVEIYTHRHNLQKVDNIKYYFLAAFRNRLFFLLKKESKNYEITEKDTADLQEIDHQEKWIENENRIEKEVIIEHLFSQLNKHQQEVLYHRFVEGLSCEEIADLMEINYQSAKNLIHRAIKKLKSIATFKVFF